MQGNRNFEKSTPRPRRAYGEEMQARNGRKPHKEKRDNAKRDMWNYQD